jgi:hypothetical protein
LVDFEIISVLESVFQANSDSRSFTRAKEPSYDKHKNPIVPIMILHIKTCFLAVSTKPGRK